MVVGVTEIPGNRFKNADPPWTRIPAVNSVPPFFFLNARNRYVVTGCVLSGSGRGWVGSGKGKQTRGFSPFCADHGARGLDKKRKNGADVAEKGAPDVFNGG